MKEKQQSNQVKFRKLCPYVYNGDCTEHFSSWSEVVIHLRKDHGEKITSESIPA
jgi:hypothetical protein